MRDLAVVSTHPVRDYLDSLAWEHDRCETSRWSRRVRCAGEHGERRDGTIDARPRGGLDKQLYRLHGWVYKRARSTIDARPRGGLDKAGGRSTTEEDLAGTIDERPRGGLD